MKYCRKCLIPDTKPFITFDQDGVCTACQWHELKKKHLGGIDWDQRKKEFEKIVFLAKSKKAPFYDVLVPVSGGKDSLTQIHSLLKYDLRILAVNIDYGIKTEIGLHNLSLVPEMGANLIIYRPALGLHKKIIRIGLEDFGDPDLLSHTMLHGYPSRVALQFQIPMVLLGENSAFEYGGNKEIAQQNCMSRAWFASYAANNGRDASYISRRYNIPMSKMLPYDFPDELETSDTQAVFMSYYFPWDSIEHLEIAKSYGFKSLEKPGEGTYRSYVGIDEKINRIHQYFKVLKFGYGRATDHACEDIRCGRITREEAKELVRKYDLNELSDDYVDDFVKFLGYTREEFFEILERYRNHDIWARDENGKWCIPGHLEDSDVEKHRLLQNISK